MQFSLVDDPWLPVVRAGGTELRSLRDALHAAAGISALTAPALTQVPAMLRQALLPVLIDATGLPRHEEEWADRWEAGQLDLGAVDAYLDLHASRFELFDPVQPFAQVGGLAATSGETKPSSLLIPSLASGNNVPLFSGRTEAEAPSLTAAEAARWLLHLHCWDTAGTKGGAVGDPMVKAGITTGNPTGPLGRLGVVIPQGRTLFETLLLNLPLAADGLRADDVPQWRRPVADATWAARPVKGLLDLLTWQARRVLLLPEEGPHGTVVRRVVVAAGDRQDATPDVEPHTTWRIAPKPKRGEPPRRPQRHRAGRTAWQGLEALLSIHADTITDVESSQLLGQVANLQSEALLDDSYPLWVLAVGMVYDKHWAVVKHVVVDELPLPVAALRADRLLRDFLVEVVNQVEELCKALNHLASDLRRALGGDGVRWDQGQRPEVALVHELDPVVRRLLTGLQREPGKRLDARAAWEQTAYRKVRAIADGLIESSPPSAFSGRERDGRRYTSSLAENRFHAKVAELLPLRRGRTDDDSIIIKEAS